MGIARRASVAVVLACGACGGCGGVAVTRDGADAGPSADASHADAADATAPPGDAAPSDGALPCTTACNGADASDAVADGEPVDAPAAPDANDAPDDVDLDATDNEACRIDWPQQAGLYMSTADMRLAVDSLGNTFVAIGYGNGTEADDDAAALAFGVALPGYPEGFVVAKIDSGCHLVWAKEFGFPHVASAWFGIEGLGVDALSNVTVMGSFSGSIDLGAGVVDALPVIEDDAGEGRITADTFLLRLGASGGLLFSKVFRASDGPVVGTSLAVTPEGISTLLAGGGSAADFGAGPVDAGAGPGSGSGSGPFSNLYLAQFDLLGDPTLVEVRTPNEPTYQALVADPTGGLWALGTAPEDGGWIQSMMRLDSIGGLAWSRAIDPAAGFAVGAEGEVVFTPATYYSLPGDETLTYYTTDGMPTASCATTVAYLGEIVATQLALEPSGALLVGGTFEGTLVTYADGSFTQTQSPVGVGFQRFDSSGVLRGLTATGGVNAELGAMGVGPDGDAVLLGFVDQPTISSPPPSAFLVKFLP